MKPFPLIEPSSPNCRSIISFKSEKMKFNNIMIYAGFNRSLSLYKALFSIKNSL